MRWLGIALLCEGQGGSRNAKQSTDVSVDAKLILQRSNYDAPAGFLETDRNLLDELAHNFRPRLLGINEGVISF